MFGHTCVQVEFAGGVSGRFEWPKHLKPVAWNPEANMARMKLGLYHKEDKVADGEVEIRDVSIEGPNGLIRTSPEVPPFDLSVHLGLKMCHCFRGARDLADTENRLGGPFRRGKMGTYSDVFFLKVSPTSTGRALSLLC